MWRPRPGKPGPVKLAASRCAGHPCPPQGQARKRAASRALPRSQPAPVAASVLRRGPAPTNVGAVGPSAPPARSAALRPALPARPRLRRRPCRSALPTHTPPGVAALRGSRWATSGPRLAAAQALAPLRAASSRPACAGRSASRPCGGPQLRPPRALAAHSAAFPALRARRGAGERRLRAGMPAGQPAGKAKASPAQGGKAAHKRGPCLPVSRPAGENVAGVPACAGSPPIHHSAFGGACLCLLLRVVCLALAASGGSCAALAALLAGLCPGLLGLSGRLRWRRLLLVSWRRCLLLAVSGLLVRPAGGWWSCGANKKRPSPGDKAGGGLLPTANNINGRRQEQHNAEVFAKWLLKA